MELRRIGGVWIALYRKGLTYASAKNVGDAIALAYARAQRGHVVHLKVTCEC